jgi:transcription elongation factor GreA
VAGATITDETLLMTADGFERLSRELEALRADGRRELAERLREARHGGDLADSAALYELLEEQAQLEGRIALLADRLATAEVVAPPSDGRAGIGSVVRVRDGGHEYEVELVGPLEGDAAGGRVSLAAPVGRALAGRRAGETVHVETPRGRRALEILAVSAAAARTRRAA